MNADVGARNEMNIARQRTCNRAMVWVTSFSLILMLCLTASAVNPTNADLRTSCEEMLAQQREYDTTHHALTVASGLARMADEISARSSSEALPLLQHPDWEIRHAAATALKKTLRKEDHAALVHALDVETNNYVLSELVGCVSATGTREAAPTLCLLLQRRVDDNIRREAVVALRAFPTPEAVPALIRVLDDPSEQVAVEVPYVLGLMKDRRATAKLCAIARDPLRPTRLGAIQALGMIGDPDAAITLHDLLAGQDDRVIQMAAWSLGRAHDKQTVTALLPLLGHAEPAIANEARMSLVEIGDDQVLIHFIGQYRKNTDDSLALGVIRSIYGQRDGMLGELVTNVTSEQTAALVRPLSIASNKRVESSHIKSVRRLDGILFVQAVFDGSGSDFIVVREDDGTIRGADVILSWIE